MTQTFACKSLVHFTLSLILTQGLAAQGIINTVGTHIIAQGTAGIIVKDGGLTNNGTLRINTDASIILFTNFNNTAAGKLENNGNFYIKGNITNDQPAMNAGTGTLHVNGATTQMFAGAHPFKTFHFVSNNTTGILLNNDLSVAGIHNFSSGMITTSATPNFLIYEAGSSYTESSDTRHVNGWVKKTGSTNFVFPVGNPVYERPVSLLNLSAPGEFMVLYQQNPTPNRYSVFNPLIYVDTSERWTINKLSGAAAQVAMNWDNSKINFPNMLVTDIRAVSFDGLFWRSIGGAALGSSSATGSITSNSISVFNTDFTFGSISNVLPLKIIYFTAARMNDLTRINWAIVNEQRVDHYELERSDDGIHFYTVYTYTPYNGTGTGIYSFDDMYILKGTVYYRLKVHSTGTSINYSHTVNISANSNTKVFYVINNPVDGMIQFYANTALKGTFSYIITNTGGQTMQTGILDIQFTGIYTIPLRSNLATGAYILVLQNETSRLQRTVIKK